MHNLYNINRFVLQGSGDFTLRVWLWRISRVTHRGWLGWF